MKTLRSLWAFLCFLADMILPRIVSEEVALVLAGPDPKNLDCYEIACSLKDVRPYERFDGVATAHSFSMLFFGFAYKLENFRPWSAR